MHFFHPSRIVVLRFQKSAEDKIAEMERQHSEDLANKDKQISVQINEAVVKLL